MGLSAAETRTGGPMKPLMQEANGCITAGNGTSVEGCPRTGYFEANP